MDNVTTVLKQEPLSVRCQVCGQGGGGGRSLDRTFEISLFLFVSTFFTQLNHIKSKKLSLCLQLRYLKVLIEKLNKIEQIM